MPPNLAVFGKLPEKSARLGLTGYCLKRAENDTAKLRNAWR